VTTLMMPAGPADADSTAMRTGGRPLLPADAEWPMCRECEGAQQFVAHLPLPDGPALEVFMCANDPGMCDAHAAGSGANAVMVAKGEVTSLAAPEEGETALADVTAITLVAAEGDYEDLVLGEDVLGQLGGEPAWIQDPETPDCPECGDAMAFAAQLEEHSSINFGAGTGYVFACRLCERGEFVFQC
jgi:hypothetical protein